MTITRSKQHHIRSSLNITFFNTPLFHANISCTLYPTSILHMIQIHAFQTLSLPFPCSAFFYMQVFHFRFIYNSSSLTHFTYFQSTSSILKPFFLLITFFSLTRTSLLFTNFTFFKNTGWNPRFFLFFFFPFLHFFLFIYALFLHTPSVISFINLFSCTISFHI